MAQVPYSGAPEVSPQFSPTPGVGISTPPAAFGEATAEATQRLGNTASQVGAELFDRAYAMQQLHVAAVANAGIADFQNKSLDSFIGYLNTEGKNAVDGYQPFVEGLDRHVLTSGAHSIPPSPSRCLTKRVANPGSEWQCRRRSMRGMRTRSM